MSMHRSIDRCSTSETNVGQMLSIVKWFIVSLEQFAVSADFFHSLNYVK